MKKTLLFTIASLTLSTAFAQNDPVIEQIKITRDAVGVALDEISKGAVPTSAGPDAEYKMKEFSANATKVLQVFEEKVRIRVLQSMSVLVNQYNTTLGSRSISWEAKKDILDSLLKQLQLIAKDKSQVYKQAYLELYSVLPDLPVQYDWDTHEELNYRQKPSSLYSNSKQLKEGPLWNERYYKEFSYTGDVYFAKTGTKKLEYSNTRDNYNNNETGARGLFEKAGIQTTQDARTKILNGCFTSSCYFLMQSQYTTWKSMIESSLARDITIELQGGQKLVITKNVSRNGYAQYTYDNFLMNVNTEGLINNLPFEISPERFEILAKVDELLAAGKCRSTKSLQGDLCTRTKEGCLSAPEVDLLKDRYSKNASCLGSK